MENISNETYILLVHGLSLAKEGNYNEALEIFDTLTGGGQQSDIVWVAKGRVLTHLGRYMEAYQAFSTALKINPDNQSARSSIDIVVQHINEEIPMPVVQEPAAAVPMEPSPTQKGEDSSIGTTLLQITEVIIGGFIGLGIGVAIVVFLRDGMWI